MAILYIQQIRACVSKASEIMISFGVSISTIQVSLLDSPFLPPPSFLFLFFPPTPSLLPTYRLSNDPSGINGCLPMETLVLNLTKISGTINTFLALPIVRVSANFNSKKVRVLSCASNLTFGYEIQTTQIRLSRSYTKLKITQEGSFYSGIHILLKRTFQFQKRLSNPFSSNLNVLFG